MNYINVEFPGGLRVDANFGDYTICTDQPKTAGGEDSAPTPFDLFLGSIATCTGIYALGFCKNKNISTEGMHISMSAERNIKTGLISKIVMDLNLPKDFPMKYEAAIIRSMELCAVKRHLQIPPEFEIVTTKK